jgi:hypothetical protein
MRIATYNVNGINGRLANLLGWLSEAAPDIVCLKELKAPDDKFPAAAVRAAGYGAVWHGQKSWNGVAFLVRGGLTCQPATAAAKINFTDAAKLPKSLPAFDEAKPVAKPVVSADRAAALLANIREPHDVLAQAQLYQATLAETGWAPAELARRLHSDPVAMRRSWNDVIYHLDVLALETEYQSAVAAGALSLIDAYELYRVPAEHRGQLFAAFRAGQSRAAVRRMARELGSYKAAAPRAA